jgi:hypothetical protein
MAREHTGKPRRAIDPLVGVATEGVGLGYQAVELVMEGLRESLRLQSRRGAPPPPSASRSDSAAVPLRAAEPTTGRAAHSPPNSSPAVAAGLAADAAEIVAELFARAGSVVEEIAHALGERSDRLADAGPSVPELPLEVEAGQPGTLEFTVWNTGPTALRAVTLSATDLIGAGTRANQDAITFTPGVIAQLGPGRSQSVEVGVEVPVQTPPGVYRGLIQAEPGDTCAVIELTVIAATPRRSHPRPRGGNRS